MVIFSQELVRQEIECDQSEEIDINLIQGLRSFVPRTLLYLSYLVMLS